MDLKSGLKIVSGQLNTTFVLDKRLGSGTYGEVWRAFNTTTQTYVAIKFMLPQPQNLEKSLHYFSREIEALKALSKHANIPDYFGYDNLQGRLYFVMKYIEGPSLKDLNDADKTLSIPFGQRYRYIQQLCNALAFVHSRNYVHSDIKPDNVKFDGDIAYLIDFGIGFNESAEQTATEIGTPIYMHPKYARTRQGDIYGMVLVAYELLFGRHPIFTPQDMGVLNSLTVINETVQRLVNQRWQLPSKLDTSQFHEKWSQSELEALDRVFKKGLALDETEAFPTIEEFSRSITFLQQKARTAPSSSSELPSTEPASGGKVWDTTSVATLSVSQTEIEELARRRSEDDTFSRLRQSRQTLPILPSLAVIGFLIVVIALILVLQGQRGDSASMTPSAQVVAEVTEEATAEVAAIVTDEPLPTATEMNTATPEPSPTIATATPTLTYTMAVIAEPSQISPSPTATFTLRPSLTPTQTVTSSPTPSPTRPFTLTPSATATFTPTPTLRDDFNELFRIGQAYEDTKNYNCRQFNIISQRLNVSGTEQLTASELEAVTNLLADKDYQTIRDYCRERDSDSVPAGTQLESPNAEFTRSLRRYINQLGP